MKFKVWFTKDDKPVLGRGGVELLMAIDEAGSLHAAAKKLGYSYSFAWTYIRRLEKSLGTKLVKFSRGGYRGGSAKLTDEGRELINLYLRVESEIEKTLKNLL